MSSILPQGLTERPATLDDLDSIYTLSLTHDLALYDEFYHRGQQRAGLDVDSQNLTGAVRLYERAGMHKARETITYEKELRAGVELSTQTLAI